MIKELAEQESGALDYHHVGTERILLGLIREGNGGAARRCPGWAPTWTGCVTRWSDC